VRLEGLGKFKNSPHRVSNPRPSASVSFLKMILFHLQAVSFNETDPTGLNGWRGE
jgi:hypothetical protein